jgi:superfamily I DNA/RNA helicase
MPKTPRAATKKNAPRAPKKEAIKKIPESSPYYTYNNENNNLSFENLNATPVNLAELVEVVRKYPGNSPLPFSHKNLNYAGIPKMKLPPHLQGGNRTKKRSKKSKKSSKKRTLRK